MAPTASLSTRAGFASQGPSARVTDRMYGTSEVPTVHANGTADSERSIGWRRRIGQRPPSRRRGGHCGSVDHQPLNGTPRCVPATTRHPVRANPGRPAREMLAPQQIRETIVDRPVGRPQIALAVADCGSCSLCIDLTLAPQPARRDAQVPDQTGPHHAIHRAVPCAFLVSSRHAAG